MPHLNGTIDRFEGDLAIIILENKEQFTCARNVLPANAIEGMAVKIFITTDEAETENRTQQAKELLNQILNNK